MFRNFRSSFKAADSKVSFPDRLAYSQTLEESQHGEQLNEVNDNEQ